MFCSNGTWFNGIRLEKNQPERVVFDESKSHEIVLPCDEPNVNEHTFVLSFTVSVYVL